MVVPDGGASTAPSKSRKRARKGLNEPKLAPGDLPAEQAPATEAVNKELRARAKKFDRGPRTNVKLIEDKKLKGMLKAREKLVGEAVLAAAKAEQYLLPGDVGLVEAEGVERTSNFSQADIVMELPLAARSSAMDLKLPQLGPYALDYSANGRFLLLGGKKGHLALLDWRRSHLVAELQVRESVRAVKFLHSEEFFAVAQKKYAYIYDKRGVEIHCLKSESEPLALEFLPQHFLLASVGRTGVVQWQDTSTGGLVAQHRTRLGRCAALTHNPANGVLTCGHSNGSATLWAPNMGSPLASLLCHRGPVLALAYEQSGHYMVTSGIDGQLKVWDVRTFKSPHSYFSRRPAKALCLSQRGLLAVGAGSGVQVWADALAGKAKAPYLTHRLAAQSGAQVDSLRFCPYEDVLGVGHSQGFSSLVVPGAGEPNFDSMVANPFETRQQRREKEVAVLLDKLQPEMIVMDPQAIGTVQRDSAEFRLEKQGLEAAANRRALAGDRKITEKNKTKGRSRPSKRHRAKQSNIVEEKKPRIAAQVRALERSAKQGASTMGHLSRDLVGEAAVEASPALAQFSKRGR